MVLGSDDRGASTWTLKLLVPSALTGTGTVSAMIFGSPVRPVAAMSRPATRRTTIWERPRHRYKNSPNEICVNAFDNSTATKWLDFANAFPATRSSWIQYRYPGTLQCILSQYTVSSTNDSPPRDPANWRLLGSSDGGSTWSTLDVRASPVFTKRYQKLAFTPANKGAYNICRFQIDSVATPASANSVQLSELQFIGNPAYSSLWDFGDGATSTAQNPQHTYANDGTFTVRLTISYGAATATASTNVSVQPLFLTASQPWPGALAISWPAWGSNGSLYFATNRLPPVLWSRVTNAVITQGGSNSVTFPNAAGDQFFQFRGP